MDWPLLAPLAPGDRSAVLAAARTRRFRRGDVLFHEGDPADALHLVLRGHFLVQISTEDGDVTSLTTIGPGDHVGELALLPHATDQTRSATVVAILDAETLTLAGSAFRSLCEHNPGVQGLLVDLLAARARELSSRLLEARYVGFERRLYRRLLELGEQFAGDADPPVSLPLTQEQLAGLVGGTRQSVNQVLQRLADAGIVEIGRGRVVLTDPAALERKARR